MTRIRWQSCEGKPCGQRGRYLVIWDAFMVPDAREWGVWSHILIV